MPDAVGASRLRFPRFPVLCAAAILGGCLPYTVGTTAQTLAPREVVPSVSTYYIPSAIESPDDTTALPIFGVDSEVRLGLDERSDVGVRLPSGAGIVINYKRRLGANLDSSRPAVAVMVGGGVVNFAEHAYVEATLVASGRQSLSLTPYGGVRVMQTLPLTDAAVSDQPTAGVFFGVRLGSVDRGISPEIGVFYDHSALGLRRRDVIVVPSVTVHGSDLLRLVRNRW